MATAAGAIIARAHREVEELFFDNDAFSPDRAVEFEPRMGAQRRYLEQMIAEGVVHQPSEGRYWMDLKAYNTLRREKFIWGLRIVGLGAVVALIVAAVQQLG
jgi:hypothetical protein